MTTYEAAKRVGTAGLLIHPPTQNVWVVYGYDVLSGDVLGFKSPFGVSHEVIPEGCIPYHPPRPSSLGWTKILAYGVPSSVRFSDPDRALAMSNRMWSHSMGFAPKVDHPWDTIAGVRLINEGRR